MLGQAADTPSLERQVTGHRGLRREKEAGRAREAGAGSQEAQAQGSLLPGSCGFPTPAGIFVSQQPKGSESSAGIALSQFSASHR